MFAERPITSHNGHYGTISDTNEKKQWSQAKRPKLNVNSSGQLQAVSDVADHREDNR